MERATTRQPLSDGRTGLLLLVFSLAIPLSIGHGSDDDHTATPDARIAQWIVELGSDQFVTRERAQQELQRAGVAAFDSLLDAQHHEDLEIAARARYLLRSMRVPWALENDAVDVKNILRNYESGGRDERKNRMEQLAMLDDSHGVVPLCRLVRFEPDTALSKRAALLAMGHKSPVDAESRTRLAQAICAAVAGSRRDAAHWMSVYAATLENPATTLAEWESTSSAETKLLARFPEESDRSILRDLLRWRSELLLRLKRSDEALAVLRQAMALMGSDRQEIFDMLDWSLEHQVWQMADALAARFESQFQADALLMYRWAEAQLKSGQPELAEKSVTIAMAMEPDRTDRHIETARRLIDRLAYDWAQRELRQVIATAKPGDEGGLEARFYLSDLLFDLQQELASAQVLQEAVDAIDKDSKILQNFNRTPGAVRGLMHYRYAMHCAKTGDRSGQRQRLEEAVRQSPTDIDVLIAMYRLPDADEAWKRGTVERISAVGGRLRDAARQYEEMAQNPVNQRLRSDVATTLASLLNQYAWLVSNTEGDFQESLRASRRSIELASDNSAYYDTLGRCYYALNDLENAAKSQTRAVQLEPSSQQIRRQLESFQRELAAKRNSTPAGASK
jgi:tetratricopeptide (TPR) repeat protein